MIASRMSFLHRLISAKLLHSHAEELDPEKSEVDKPMDNDVNDDEDKQEVWCDAVEELANQRSLAEDGNPTG